MADYLKKIIYLDYLENGMKVSNAGFVRIEESNGQTRLEMRVKNIPETCSGQYEWMADTGGVIGRISVSRGSGGSCIVWQTGGHAPDGKQWKEANGIYVRLPGRRLLQAVWPEPMRLLAEADPEKTKQETETASKQVEEIETTLRQAAEEAINPERTESAQSLTEKSVVRSLPEMEDADSLQPEAENADSLQPEAENGDALRQEQAERRIPPVSQPEMLESRQPLQQEPAFYGDKWEQLMHVYPVIHPFGDERDYLSLEPKDFIIMSQEYQKMVHNSFLLHGYYNYRHLILGRIKTDSEWHYYLGVPGNFYTREKMVAEMFGFEAFEGEKIPAKSGDFGYFMKQVEI